MSELLTIPEIHHAIEIGADLIALGPTCFCRELMGLPMHAAALRSPVSGRVSKPRGSPASGTGP